MQFVDEESPLEARQEYLLWVHMISGEKDHFIRTVVVPDGVVHFFWAEGVGNE